MRRRAYLLAGVATVAGCLNPASDPPETPQGPRRLHRADASVPGASDVAVAAEITEPTIDSQQTATFELTVTWTGPGTGELGFGNEIPFSYPNYSSDRSGLVLLPANTSMERASTDAWVPKTSESGGIPARQNAIRSSLQGGESVAGDWGVWADPGEAGFVRPEAYYFENTIGVDGDDGQDVEWTLTLEIERGATT